MIIKSILAVTREGGIGKDNGLPWKIKEDMEFFKKTTRGNSIVVGSKTALSLKGPLRDRDNYLLSRRGLEIKGFISVSNIEYLASKFKDEDKTLFVCGGAEIYNAFAGMSEEVIITTIKGDYDADVFVNLDKILKNYYLVDTRPLGIHDIKFYKLIKD